MKKYLYITILIFTFFIGINLINAKSDVTLYLFHSEYMISLLLLKK